MNQKGAKAAGHHRHELLALLSRRAELGGDLEENIIPVEESMRCYTRLNPSGTSSRGKKYEIVVEVLGEGPKRYMLVDCGNILLQGRKDEPVATSIVKLEDGTLCLLLAEDSLFGRNPKMRRLVAPKKAFVGSGGNTRHIPLPEIAEGFVPVRQLNPMAGLMGIKLRKPAVAV